MNLGLEINIWIMDSNFFGLLKFLENIGDRNIKECREKIWGRKKFWGWGKISGIEKKSGLKFWR